MSHRATSWVATLAGISSSEFRVLFHLCDCHNPIHGCYPSQSFLMQRCELSNGTVNATLASLEVKGLIRRQRTFDPATQRRMNTRYFLAFEDQTAGSGRAPSPEVGEGLPARAISSFGTEPSPVLGPSHLQPTGDKPVRGTCNETGKGTPTPSGQGDLLGSDTDRPQTATKTQDAFERFWAAFPDGRKTDKPKARTTFHSIVAGKHKGIERTDAETIITGAVSYARSNPDPQFVPMPRTWLNGQRWLVSAPTKPANDPPPFRPGGVIR